MKSRNILCMVFMLLVFMSAQVFAGKPPQKVTTLTIEEKSMTYLDTVVVTECYKEPFYAMSRDEDGNPTKKQIGDKYTLHLSNGLIYDKILFYDFSMREDEEKGVHSIYYVRRGDPIVVKVDFSYGYDIVVEIVQNLKFY